MLLYLKVEKAIESFEMIDLRNEIVEEIQNKNVKIKEERD